MLDPSFLTDLFQAFALWRTRLRSTERASRAEVLALQTRRLAELLAYAAARSPLYRRRWAGRTPTPETFGRLEPVDKETLLSRGFDEALTTRGLSLAVARGILGARATRQRGKYVVVTTSGTTGHPAVFPYSRREWREAMAYTLRHASWALRGAEADGLEPLPRSRRRLRVAGIGTLNPIHVSTQLAASFQTGLFPTLTLPAGLPLPAQLAALDDFRPLVLGGYPSAIGPLAEASLSGSLAVRPRLVFTGGETVTPGLRARVQAAWGLELFDYYGTTEMIALAGECPLHNGLHVHEDAVILEVVDEKGAPVPAGRPGAGVLITSLLARTLPVIRYKLTDVVTLSDEPCPCGLPFRRIVSIEGRREERFPLRTRAGDTVQVHPFTLESPLEELGGVRRFQLRPDGNGGVRVLVAGPEADPEAVRDALEEALAPLGVDPAAVEVEKVEDLELPRGPTDKVLRPRL